MAPSSVGSHRWVALTQGDPAGIGPEIILKAFALDQDASLGCVVLGHKAVFERALQVLKTTHTEVACIQSLRLRLVSGKELMEGSSLWSALLSKPHEVPLLDLSTWGPSESMQAAWHHLRGESLQEAIMSSELPSLGVVSALAGHMAALSVVSATQFHLEGLFQAVVTAPLHKASLNAAGWRFAGHTELLQAHSAWFLGVPVRDLPVRMMLSSEALRVVLVSIHISLKEAIEQVQFEGVLETVRIAHQALERILGRKPKMAMAGLNPHAGESGLMGQEEVEILLPVVQKATALGIDLTGPIAPDTVFMRARSEMGHEGEFDAVIAMYHDQGLIPMKYLGLDTGVNVTLGLPVLRTSPDHGTAFDLAGSGLAREQSMIQAIRFAKKITPNQA